MNMSFGVTSFRGVELIEKQSVETDLINMKRVSFCIVPDAVFCVLVYAAKQHQQHAALDLIVACGKIV